MAARGTHDAEATAVECPTCGAWIGWACKGPSYGYHAAGYHPARERAATRITSSTKAKGTP